MSTLGDVLGWELRYKQMVAKWSGPFKLFDWYAPFSQLWPIIEGLLTNISMKQKILVLGVGRSDIIECLYKHGHRDIVAIDISPTIIREMQTKYSSYSGVEFISMDVVDLSAFPDEFFSLVIDKGCLDSIFCRTDYNIMVVQTLKGIQRLLMKDRGVYVCISHASPSSRIPYFRQVEWAVDTCSLGEGEGLQLFMLLKTTDQALLNKKFKGAEAVVVSRSSNVVSTLDKQASAPKSSVSKKGGAGGAITVTASVDVLAAMVEQSVENEG